jgi:AcrR family transcriptional regulator
VLVTRREPVQHRSRAKVEEIVKAASELLAEGGVDSLTTTAVAERTGIPIATIYRYFDDRNAIIAAYLDRDLGDVEQTLDASLLESGSVRFREVSEAAALARMRYYQRRPEAVAVWLGGSLNPAVAEQVRARNRRVLTSIRHAAQSTGMLEGAPEFAAELLMALYHQMFQYVFLTERTAEEQEEIVLFFVNMVAKSMESYETPDGVRGIPAEDVIRAIKEA